MSSLDEEKQKIIVLLEEIQIQLITANAFWASICEICISY